MVRALLLASLVLLATSAVALAARGEPRDRPNAKDMGRARSVVLTKADLGAAFRAVPAPKGGDGYCAALDESSLTRTGKAESPVFTQAATLITSRVDVYETLGDAETSWRQGVSPAGRQCFKAVLGGTGVAPTVSKLAFPRLAKKTFALRVDGAATFDLIVLQEGRIQAVTAFVSGVGPLAKADEVALMKLVAARLKRAAAS